MRSTDYAKEQGCIALKTMLISDSSPEIMACISEKRTRSIVKKNLAQSNRVADSSFSIRIP